VLFSFLGVFILTPLVVYSLEISPYFDARRDVIFLVFTQANPTNGSVIEIGDPESLKASAYDPSLETRYLLKIFKGYLKSSISILIMRPKVIKMT
jgi:hypothetical protein